MIINQQQGGLLTTLFNLRNMCFIISDTKVRKAIRNIKCYKVVSKCSTGKGYSITNFYGYYQSNFRYKKGVTYYNSTIESKKANYFHEGSELDRHGFHSYTVKDNVEHYLRRGMPGSGIAVVECIIPKGSLYLINKESKEYISSAIKIVKILIPAKYRKVKAKVATSNKYKIKKKNGKRKAKV